MEETNNSNNGPIAPVIETKSETSESGQSKSDESKKAPPSTKDWASITAAEKRARAIEAKAKEEAKRIQAEKTAWENQKKQKEAGLELLQEAYKNGKYEDIEKLFPDLYKNLTKAKLKTPTKPIQNNTSKLSEEEILKKFEEKMELKAKEEAKKAAENMFAQHESNFVYTLERNKDKFPLLIMESEENPDLIRSKLREIANGSETMTYEAAAEKLEKWLNTKFEKRQQILGKRIESNSPKSEVNSSKESTKEQNVKKTPSTLTQRMMQESSYNSYEPEVESDENSPTAQIRKKMLAEKAQLNQAIADFKEMMKKN